MNIAPALSVLFSVQGESRAVLCLRGNVLASAVIKIIHDDVDVDLLPYKIGGNQCLSDLAVSDDDTLFITIFDAFGSVIAHGVFDVQFAYIRDYGAILAPQQPCTLEIDQQNADRMDGIVASIEAFFGSPVEAML